MMVAGVKYAYTIEIGPLDNELKDENLSFGFHVEEKKIKYIVERAFTGLYEYLRLFVDKLKPKMQQNIERKCFKEYKNLMDTFTGYWS